MKEVPLVKFLQMIIGRFYDPSLILVPLQLVDRYSVSHRGAPKGIVDGTSRLEFRLRYKFSVF